MCLSACIIKFVVTYAPHTTPQQACREGVLLISIAVLLWQATMVEHPLHAYCWLVAAADPSGFLLINEFLQSAGGPPEVFATGDVATSTIHPRPKAGVFAVRQVCLPSM